jgi:phosphoribosylformylglycinamidine synthase
VKVRVLVLTGYGINCDEETCWCFKRVGADARIVHVNDLVDGHERLRDWQILVFPGGFSYGDDTGSGKALANRLRNNLADDLWGFVEGDHLVLGICNGFQVLTCLGLLPFPEGRTPRVALTYNTSARYECRWVDLTVEGAPCVFTRDISRLHVPVAHGEGRFTTDSGTYEQLDGNGQIVARYALSDGSPAGGQFPANPNGSFADVAGICDRSGRIFGLMPHPERAFQFLQRDDWPRQADRLRRAGEELPEHAEGYRIFQNAVEYFS